MLRNKEQIKQWLDQYEVKNYTINEDFTVDVDGDVNLSYKNLTNFNVQFGIVKGNFYCYKNKLTSLEGCPQKLTEYFDCSNNKLISLQGCPQKVGKNFNCNNNPIRDLNDFHCEISGIFYHTGSVIEEFSQFYIYQELILTHKKIENIKLNNKLNYTIKDKTETINTSNKKKL